MRLSSFTSVCYLASFARPIQLVLVNAIAKDPTRYRTKDSGMVNKAKREKRRAPPLSIEFVMQTLGMVLIWIWKVYQSEKAKKFYQEFEKGVRSSKPTGKPPGEYSSYLFSKKRVLHG